MPRSIYRKIGTALPVAIVTSIVAIKGIDLQTKICEVEGSRGSLQLQHVCVASSPIFESVRPHSEASDMQRPGGAVSVHETLKKTALNEVNITPRGSTAPLTIKVQAVK